MKETVKSGSDKFESCTLSLALDLSFLRKVVFIYFF